jgi:23S rRNA (guanine2445-N2)-methyltransferase / 23S rRNA (guanine2069-N7)-methyltransferase
VPVGIATAPHGTLDLVLAELKALGLESARENGAVVVFESDLAGFYRACIGSRVASRVLWVLGHGDASDPDALYRSALGIDWSAHVPEGGTIAVDFSTAHSAITHTHYGALRVKDAIVDQLRDRAGGRPSVDTVRPSVRVAVRVVNDRATFAIDFAGDSLHRRGYRAEGVAAPLKENLAAALLLRAGWDSLAAEGAPFLDPMCGSGTLPIEAALIAADIAPGLSRDWFGFMGWRGHDSELYAAVRHAAEARVRIVELAPGRIVGRDVDRRAVQAARNAAAILGLDERLEFFVGDIADAAPHGERGLLVCNPPYGERLGEESAVEALYVGLGNVMRERFLGWQAGVFTGNPPLGQSLGLRARRTHRLYNGAIDCVFLRFSLETDQFMVRRKPGELPAPNPARAESPGARMFANRLKKNLATVGRWARDEGVECYRLYDADMPEYSFAIDLYGSAPRRAYVQEYAAPSTVAEERVRGRRAEALAVIPLALDLPREQIHVRVRRRSRGGEQYTKVAEEGEFHEVGEDGLRFLVNFTDYLDTGLFLDHRLTRARLREMARGRRFLNLFCYTGTATVHAAAGGAVSTTSVDLSRTYLDWARRNLDLNGFTGPAHRLIQADVLEYLREAQSLFDLVFLDPPTFSNSKRMTGTLDVQRDHVDLLQATARRLAPGGTLVFSTNHTRFRLAADMLDGLTVEDVSASTIPRDFARNPRIHRCYVITRTQ